MTMHGNERTICKVTSHETGLSTREVASYKFVYTTQAGVRIKDQIEATGRSDARLRAALKYGCPLRRIQVD